MDADVAVDQLGDPQVGGDAGEAIGVHRRQREPLGKELAESGDTAAAIAAWERAAALVPSATGEDNPNKLIAELAIAKKDNARAIAALEAVLKVDHADVEAARALIPLLMNAPPAQLENAYQRLVNVDPFEDWKTGKDVPPLLRERRVSGLDEPLRYLLRDIHIGGRAALRPLIEDQADVARVEGTVNLGRDLGASEFAGLFELLLAH